MLFVHQINNSDLLFYILKRFLQHYVIKTLEMDSIAEILNSLCFWLRYTRPWGQIQ